MSEKKGRQLVKAAKARKKPVEAEAAAPVQGEAQRPAPQPNPDFERELQDHFAAEARKKVDEAAENIFGGVLARHGWVRNEHGQVEYVGGEGA